MKQPRQANATGDWAEKAMDLSRSTGAEYVIANIANLHQLREFR